MTVSLVLAGQNSSIEFADFELPQVMQFGGEQLLEVHQLMGGRRIIDALGPSDAPLSWSGVFLTSSGLKRARFCDTLRRTGEQCTLTWDEFSYTGVVSKFEADYTRAGLYVPYKITLTVAEDQTGLITALPTASVSSQIAGDMADAASLTSTIGDSTLTGLMGTVQSTVSSALAAVAPVANGLVSIANTGTALAASVTSTINSAIASATAAVSPALSAINSALSAVSSAQAQVQSLISSAESTVKSIANSASLVVGTPVATMVSKFTSQATAAISLPSLNSLNNILSTTTMNLGALATQGTSTTLQVAGTTLQQIAAQQYGDATLWPVLAAANSLTDPVISGVQTLIIPPQTQSA